MIETPPAEAGTAKISASKFLLWRESHFWFLIVAGIIYFHRPLFSGDNFFFRDLHMHFLPQKQLLVNLIGGGNFPLWDPYLHGGQPFLANLNNMALYPSSIFYFILPILTAFNIDIVFHFLFSGAAAYWFARVIGFSPIASLLAGGVYMFCGYTLSLGNLLNRLAAAPYWPLLAAMWHRYLLSGRRLWFVLSAVFGFVQFLAGAPEWSLITWLFILGWSLFVPNPVVARFRRWLFLVAFIVALSAIQIIPFVEMIRESARATASDYGSFSGWSLHPKRLPELIFPNFFGYPYGLGSLEYWGEKLVDKAFPYILSIYFGGVVLVLSFFGTFLKTALPRRLQYFLMICVAASLLLSLGRFFPLHRILYEALGEFNRFRYPIKFLFGACLPVALLSAAGAESIFSNRARFSYFAKGAIALLSLLILAGCSTALFFPAFVTQAGRHYFQVQSSLMESGLRWGMIHLGCVWLLFLLLLILRRFEARKFAFVALAVLVIGDLAIAGRYLNQYAPSEFYTETPKIAAVVKEHLGYGRFFRTPNPPDIVIQLPERHTLYTSRWDLATLNNYLPAYYRIPVIFHENFDGLAPNKIYQLALTTLRSSWEARLPLLAVSGVRLILTADSPDHSSIKPLGAFSTGSNKKFFLYQNEKSLNRVAFITEWEKSGNDALQKISAPDFDPLRKAIIEGVSSNKNTCSSTDNEVKIRSVSANSMTLESTTSCDGYLVFAESFYPGWKLYIDGQEAVLRPANYAFSAVFQTKGKHSIERIYRPASFVAGAGISLLSALFLAVFGTKSTRRTRSSAE